MTHHTILKALHSLGLELSAHSGGCQYGVDTPIEIRKMPYQLFRFYYPDGSNILFLNGDLFLKSVKLTEKSLKAKLFG